MKNWCLALFIFLITGCSEEEKVQEYEAIKIEQDYSFHYKKEALKNLDTKFNEIFSRKALPINSAEQLNENPLFTYFTENLKENLSQFDFEQYTLIIVSSYCLNEIEDIKYNLKYNIATSDFDYFQTLYCKPLVTPVENIYLIIKAFSVQKIPDNSKLSFTESVLINKNQ